MVVVSVVCAVKMQCTIRPHMFHNNTCEIVFVLFRFSPRSGFCVMMSFSRSLYNQTSLLQTEPPKDMKKRK